MRKAKDMFNTEILVGDYIVYPVRKGSDMYMRTAKVTGFIQEGDVTKLKAVVAIAPRAWERKADKNWQDKIELKKVIIGCSWRAKIVSEVSFLLDARYNKLLDI